MKEQTKTEDAVKATLVMELNAECPACGHLQDLFMSPQNDEGQLYHDVIDDAAWAIDPDNRLDTYVICQGCKCEFRCKGVIW